MKSSFLLLCSTSFAVFSAPAVAQQTGANIPAGNEEKAIGQTVNDNDIIVTAARHSQSLQKVSATVDVLGGSDLSQTATVNMTQALSSTPGVNTTTQPGGTAINIRGLGADTPTGTTQGSVALEFDGVYNIIALGTQTGLFDVNRIEVLKGPQGTRYGPNAEGGVVNVISNDPELGDWSGKAQITVGNYGLIRGELAQNLALGERVALRLSGAAIHRSSYYTPSASNNVAQSARVKLLAEPTDDLTVKLTYQYDHIGGTGQGSEAGYPIIISKVAPYSGDSINDSGNPWHKSDTCGTDSDGDTVCPSDNKSDVTSQTFSVGVSYNVADGVVLDATGAYMKISGSDYSCTDSGPPWATNGTTTCGHVYSYAPFNQYTAEVRLHSDADSQIQWNLGYYFWDYRQTKWDDAFQSVDGKLGGTQNGTRTNALFGEASYPLTGSLRLIGGARYSWDRRLLKPAGVATVYTANLSHFDFRAGEEYDISPDLMQYFTISSGYRPGGITYNGSKGTASVFKSEETTAYEFGLKNKFLDGRLTLNVSAFYYDQNNYQDIDSYAGYDVTLTGASSAGAVGDTYTCQNGGNQPAECSLPTFNIKNAYNIGLEWQARLMATPDDTFGFNGTFMKARFNKQQGTCATIAAPTAEGCWIGYNDQSTNALLFYNLAGTTQPHSPTLSMSVSYEHTFHLASGAKISVGGDAFHSSSYWVHPVHDAAKYGFQPGYWQENLNAGFSTSNERISVNAFVKNLSNYAVKQSTLPATTIGDPRTYGVSVGVNW